MGAHRYPRSDRHRSHHGAGCASGARLARRSSLKLERGSREGSRVAFGGKLGASPLGHSVDGLGYSTPALGIPAFSFGHDVAILTHKSERRSGFEAKALHRDPIGIGEGEELVGIWPEELLGGIGRSSHDPAGPTVRAYVGGEDPTGRVKDPCALVRIGVKDNRYEREGREPLAQRARIAIERRQFEIEGYHGGSSYRGRGGSGRIGQATLC